MYNFLAQFQLKNTSPSGKQSGQTINANTMRIIECYNNPYTKLIIVCKICNKEASKFQRNWKTHYSTHTGNQNKPHKCHICNHGFDFPGKLNKHLEKNHGTTQHGSNFKQEAHQVESFFG